jgi:hypothetical protein
MESWGRINNTQFSLQFMNRPNKLECYIIQGRKGLQVTNTVAFWVLSYLVKKIVL